MNWGGSSERVQITALALVVMIMLDPEVLFIGHGVIL